MASQICRINVLAAASLTNSKAVIIALGSVLVLQVPSTSALFFFRVKAVYYNNKIVTIFFGVLWLSMSALCFLFPQAVSATRIGTTQTLCIITRIAPYVSAPIFVHVAFDTLVFFAISF